MKKDAVLADVDSREVDAKRDVAEAAVRLAKANFDYAQTDRRRKQELFDAQLIARSELREQATPSLESFFGREIEFAVDFVSDKPGLTPPPLQQTHTLDIADVIFTERPVEFRPRHFAVHVNCQRCAFGGHAPRTSRPLLLKETLLDRMEAVFLTEPIDERCLGGMRADLR